MAIALLVKITLPVASHLLIEPYLEKLNTVSFRVECGHWHLTSSVESAHDGFPRHKKERTQ